MSLVTYDELARLALFVVEGPGGIFPFRLPSRIARRMIADLDGLFRPKRRKATHAALQLAFPELSEMGIRDLAREVSHIRWGVSDRSRTKTGKEEPSSVHAIGLERVRQALARGSGVILWESPFGSQERLQRMLVREGFRFTQVHGPEHGGGQSWFGRSVMYPRNRAQETELVGEIVDIQEGRYNYLRLLKQRLGANQVVCMPAFGPKGRRFVKIEFLGTPQYFATGVVSLAASTGAALIPVFSFQESNGESKVVFEKALDLDDRAPRLQLQRWALRQFARSLESHVRRHPEQWLRWHQNAMKPSHPKLSATCVDAVD